MASQNAYDRGRLVYELIVRQEPKQARMCGVGGKADRRPIDPPPIVQLRVIDPAGKAGGSAAAGPSRMMNTEDDSPPGSPGPRPFPDETETNYAHSFLQNPYYFMFASLARPDDDAELHWLKDGRTRCTTGSVVSSLYHLKDPQNNNEDAGFFVFPDLSVRTEGSYRLKLSLFEVVGNNVHHCKSIYSAPFYVYTAKKFPGMEESTPLSCSLADQGIKIRIRKDIRVRKRPNPALTQPLPINNDDDDSDDNDDNDGRAAQTPNRRTKRSRLDNTVDVSGQQQMPWPPVASLNPALGPNIPPPPAAPPSVTPSSSSSGRTASGSVKIPPPPKPGHEVPPENGIAMGVHLPPGSILPGPSVFDGRGGGIIPLESSTITDENTSTSTPQAQQAPPTPTAQQSVGSTTNVTPAPPTAPPQYSSQTPSTATNPGIPPPGTQQSPYPASQGATPISTPQVPQQQQTQAVSTASHPQHIAPAAHPHLTPQHIQPQQGAPAANPQAGYGAPPPHYAQWGAPPPPPQQTVYDPYYHQQQHYATYAPPPHPSAPHQPYPAGMYSSAPPPLPMSTYGYYDQHQQMMHPPHPHQAPHVQAHPGHPLPHHPYAQHSVHPGYAQAPPTTPTAPTTPVNSTIAHESTAGSTAPGNGSPSTMQQAQNMSGQQQSGTMPPAGAPGMVQQQPSQPQPATNPPIGGVPATPMTGGYDYNAAAMYNAGRPHPGHAHPPAHSGYPQGMPTYTMHPSAQQAPPHPGMVTGTSAMPRHGMYAPPPNHHPQPQPQMIQHHPHPHAPPHVHSAYAYATPYAAPPPPHHHHPAHTPIPQQHEWAPPHQQQFAMPTNAGNTGWDMYAQQQPPQQHPGYASHVQVQPQGSSTGVGTNPAGSVDRIQLAPLMASPGSGADGHPAAQSGTSGSPSMRGHPHNPSSSHSSPSMGQMPLRNGGRAHGHPYMRDGGSPHNGHAQGKKNPLSIGSIVSDDAR